MGLGDRKQLDQTQASGPASSSDIGSDVTLNLDAVSTTARPEPSPISVSLPEALPPEERYEDLGLIGSGGMGEVRRVRDRIMGRVLAMKIQARPEHESALDRARFLAEARMTATLQHPGIVPVHECGA